MTLSERSEFVIFCIVFSKVLMRLVLPDTCSRSIIHPICSPFFHFRKLYKSPLNPDSAIYSVVCGRAPSGKEAAERDGGEGKDKIFGIKNRLKNIIENMSRIMIGAIIETIE